MLLAVLRRSSLPELRKHVSSLSKEGLEDEICSVCVDFTHVHEEATELDTNALLKRSFHYSMRLVQYTEDDGPCYRVLKCAQCRRLVDRDINAVTNIVFIALHILLFDKHPFKGAEDHDETRECRLLCLLHRCRAVAELRADIEVGCLSL